MATFSYMKFLIHMSNELVQNLTCEMLVHEIRILHLKDSRVKINYEEFISHVELKQFTC